MPLSAKERQEKKRIAEKNRRERMKANPELHNAVKAKARDRYYRSKARGEILPASEMTLQQKKLKQLRDRLKSKLYRERKKQMVNSALEEDLVFCEDKPPIANDPLYSPPRKPPIRKSSQKLSKQLQSTGTSTPLPDPSTRSVVTIDKSPNSLPSCTKTTSNDDFSNIAGTSKPMPPKKLYSRAWVDDGSSTISQSTNSDTSPLSNIDTTSTANPKRQKRSRAGNKTLKKEMNQLEKDAFEKKRMHKRIEELKTLNAKYRKRLSRLKKKILDK